MHRDPFRFEIACDISGPIGACKIKEPDSGSEVLRCRTDEFFLSAGCRDDVLEAESPHGCGAAVPGRDDRQSQEIRQSVVLRDGAGGVGAGHHNSRPGALADCGIGKCLDPQQRRHKNRMAEAAQRRGGSLGVGFRPR